jgi:hypothetical protein
MNILPLRAPLVNAGGSDAERHMYRNRFGVIATFFRDNAAMSYYCSRHALLIGATEDAWEHAKACHRKQVDARVPEGGRTTIMMQDPGAEPGGTTGECALAPLGRLQHPRTGCLDVDAHCRGRLFGRTGLDRFQDVPVLDVRRHGAAGVEATQSE